MAKESHQDSFLFFIAGLCSHHDPGVDMTMDLSVCRCPENDISGPHCSLIYASKLSTSSRWILIKPKYYCLWNSHFHCDFNSVHTLGLRTQRRGCSFIFIKITALIFMLLFRLPDIYNSFYLDFFLFFLIIQQEKKSLFSLLTQTFLQNVDTGKNIKTFPTFCPL